MNKLIITVLAACLITITACREQQITQIPHPSQERQVPTPQVSSASSLKWTAVKCGLSFGVLALLGWNWKRKVYYRAKSNMQGKFIEALNASRRKPDEPVNPEVINNVYIKAAKAIDDLAWKCAPKGHTDLNGLRELVCEFITHDPILTDATKQQSLTVINQEAVRSHPAIRERVLKFKHDVNKQIRYLVKSLISRN